MTTPLSNLRSWWRPVLGGGTAVNCIAYPWAALAIALVKPEAGGHAVAAMVALFGFASAIWGFREWGKREGNE